MTNKFKRTLVNGSWVYTDEQESLFVSTVCLMGQYPIESIDGFIESGQLSDEVRSELMDVRQGAFEAFKAGNDALADAWLAGLHYACRFYGLQLGALPLVLQAQKQNATNRVNAARPRPKTTPEGLEWTMAGEIAKLAREKDALGDPLPTKDLWPRLFGRLDELGLEPVQSKTDITYDVGADGLRKTTTYRSFSSTLSQERKKFSS